MEIPFHQKNTFEIPRVDEAADMHAQYKGEMLHSGRVKLFMDGVMETLTALMLDDYPGHPGNTGAPLFTAAEFKAIATRADKHKLQISVHAIADGAVRRTLDGFEFAQKQNGKRDSRHRIEHIELIDPADIPRLKQLGVIASLQPIAGIGMPWSPHEPILSRVGDKLPYAYAWQTLRNAGATIAFSSDWPVAPLDPFLGIEAAMIAKPVRPDCPNQAQSLMDALHSFTAAGAIMEFMEDRKGMLKVGYLADVIVLNADIEKTAIDEMRNVKPVMTVCDGRVVWET
jgi:predicted amidohydrolase YtcJ